MLRSIPVVLSSSYFVIVIDWPGERFLHPCHVLPCFATLSLGGFAVLGCWFRVASGGH